MQKQAVGNITHELGQLSIEGHLHTKQNLCRHATYLHVFSQWERREQHAFTAQTQDVCRDWSVQVVTLPTAEAILEHSAVWLLQRGPIRPVFAFSISSANKNKIKLSFLTELCNSCKYCTIINQHSFWSGSAGTTVWISLVRKSPEFKKSLSSYAITAINHTLCS